MKDRQGIQRGRCNECSECTEYVAPSTGARCDYCDHVPTKHVQIIKLGPCKKCDGECEEYISEEKTSYTDCQYCGCKAADHKGAEKLRKTPPKPPTVSTQHVSSAMPRAMPTPSTTTTAVAGNQCKYPGCSRACFIEQGGKVHEFCGKTHAQKFKQQVKSPIPPSLGISPPSMKPPVIPPSVLQPPPPAYRSTDDGDDTPGDI